MIHLVLALAWGLWTTAVPGAAATQNPPSAATVYACPMHPDVTSPVPGMCPRCGMALVVSDPFDAREYLVDVHTTPAAIRPGAPFRMQLTVREPRTKEVVRSFATVHDKRFHLFVISHDLEHYQHIHPEQHADGSWTIDVTVPAPGFYKLYTDFLPIGGAPQVIALPLVTAGHAGDLASATADLTPDTVFTRRTGTMQARLVLPDTPLVAGREEAFALHLTDAASGTPVANLEPYLAAWGHALLVSADTLAVVHAHPVELVPVTDAKPLGGPTVTFKALFPKAEKYRLWVQLQRAGKLSTVEYTLNVESPVDQ